MYYNERLFARIYAGAIENRGFQLRTTSLLLVLLYYWLLI